MKHICLIGQFPPPIHGLSKALKIILESRNLKKKYKIDFIDIKNNRLFLKHLKKVKDIESDIYYITISQSKFGNIRDILMINSILKKKKKKKIKIIIHYHGGYYKKLYNSFSFIQKFINKKVISQVDIIIALSESLKYLFVDVIDLKKVRICENFVEDSSLISETDFQKKINDLRSKERIQVLYLSNFIESKGYWDLLEAVNELKEQNLLFHFAGAFFTDEDKEKFQKFVVDNDLDDYIVYHGVVESVEKKKLLYQCDIFVLPTYYPKEGQPISIIEAMGNGLSVITTKHAGIPDIVAQKNGALINPKSSSEIIESVQRLLDRELLIKIAKENRKYTLSKFKEEHYIERLDEIFSEVLGNEN